MNKYNIFFSIFLIAVKLNANITTKIQNVEEQSVFENISKETIVNQKKIFLKDSKTIIKKLLKSKKIPSKISRNLTKKYYRNYKYKTFWVSFNGIKKISYDLIRIINEDEVLKPYQKKLFQLDEINKLLNKNKENTLKDQIKLDIMLTSSYHQYMKYLSKGLINWKLFQEELKKRNEETEIIANWKKYDVKKNIRRLLYKSVKENNINIAIDKVNYTFPKAKELANLIKDYEKTLENGGYIKISKIKKSLKKGNYYPEIKLLRRRLFQSNDLQNLNCIEQNNQNIKEPKLDCLELYDENVFKAVKSFQKSHGLIQDGIVGNNTISKLNIPIKNKIKIMRINLERMRWMPRTLGKKYLIVNIPDYKLKMYKENQIKLDMPVVVGEYKTPTPVFSHKISAIVLNPYWRIPQSIVKKEIVPKLVKNPNYLNSKNIKVFENWNHESIEYNTSSFDWSMFLDNDLLGTSKKAPMRFIQVPSNQNPLGKMKFMFPNRYSVYLHDTPFKSLFNKNKRAFSHGCIRLSRPHDLLKTIAQEDEKVDYEEAKEILKDIEKTDFDLTKKIPVHIVYLTSWVDENGKVQFRDDIYKYDKIQGNILYN
ncbi:MAG: L,D-transpeptidase family protein [Arcobacter sp.]|nr:L,D-transpeptidase family protein [Arcobacter sp.]